MALSFDELKEKQKWVKDELTRSLKDTFNKQGISVSVGIGKNQAGEADFVFRIRDLDNPRQEPSDDIVEYAKQKLKELVPSSDAEITGADVPRAGL
jgi:hypothetical protein